MKPSFASRVHRWWTARQARHQRLEQFQLLNSLPDAIRSDIAGNSLAEVFDDGSRYMRKDSHAFGCDLHQR